MTGRGSGIGLAVATRLGAEGAYVFIAGRRQATLDEAVRLIDPNVEALRCDVTSTVDLDRLFKRVKARHDILVTASGPSAKEDARQTRAFGVARLGGGDKMPLPPIETGNTGN